MNRIGRKIVALAMLMAPAMVGCENVEDTKEYQAGYDAGYEEGIAEICAALQRRHAEIYDQVDGDIGCR